MKRITNRILSVLFVIIMFFGTMSIGITANAADTTYKYPAVTLKVPYCSQWDKNGCAMASVAMVELYTRGYRGSNKDYRKTINYDKQKWAYNKVKSYNKGSGVALASPKKFGLSTGSKLDLNKIYKELKKGRPVILYLYGKSYGYHFVVVYGCKASNKLEKKNFKVYSPNWYQYVQKGYNENQNGFGNKSLATIMKVFPSFQWAAYKTTTKNILPSNFVANPTFSAEETDDGYSVTISSKTKDAVIYYTTDGSNPTTKSDVFDINNPIEVTNTTVIKAAATKKGMTASSVVSQKYTVAVATKPSTVENDADNIYVEDEVHT